MKLFERFKNALFEEDPDEEEVTPKVKESEPKPANNEEVIVKKINVEKTFEDTKPDIKMNNFDIPKEKKAPIIFDDEDFLSDTKEISFAKTPTKEDKILYGGYEKKEEVKIQTKEKFHPSPVISPVYGLLNKNYQVENNKEERKPIDELFVNDKKAVTLDEVRQKAYGDVTYDEEPEEESNLLYEMQDKDDKPGIDKITLGDAEEYFNDLGLEYEVDYKDAAKNKMTRSSKNKNLSDEITEEEKELPAKKEVPKVPKAKTAKDIKRAKALSANDDLDNEEPDEKNLYDLIDMMYDSKSKE